MYQCAKQKAIKRTVPLMVFLVVLFGVREVFVKEGCGDFLVIAAVTVLWAIFVSYVFAKFLYAIGLSGAVGLTLGVEEIHGYACHSWVLAR